MTSLCALTLVAGLHAAGKPGAWKPGPDYVELDKGHELDAADVTNVRGADGVWRQIQTKLPMLEAGRPAPAYMPRLILPERGDDGAAAGDGSKRTRRADGPPTAPSK